MNIEAFKTLSAKWVAEKVIPAIAPEGVARWVFTFVAMAKINLLISEYASFLPMSADGTIDIEGLKTAINSAFAAQPNLSFTLPSIPALAALGMGETVITFTREDANSLLTYLLGETTVTEVAL